MTSPTEIPQKSALKKLWDNPYFFWALIAFPGIGMMYSFIGDQGAAHRLLHPSGEFAARFMIFAMLVTPFRTIWPQKGWTRWLMKRRRYLGVAAFGYAAIHTLFYVVDTGTFSKIISEIPQTGIWTGWIAFFIFVPLAMTSTDAMVKSMGLAWKKLQRWIYPAAFLTLVHWIFVVDSPGGAYVHFGILIAFQIARLTINWRKRHPV